MKFEITYTQKVTETINATSYEHAEKKAKQIAKRRENVGCALHALQKLPEDPDNETRLRNSS